LSVHFDNETLPLEDTPWIYQANEVVERWGNNRFVRMVPSMKPTHSVKLASQRTQVMRKVVGRRTTSVGRKGRYFNTSILFH